MATLIFVHGTFATGREDGERWWQRGSAFDGHLHQLIGAENGDIEVKRFVWDGNNSVTSRRTAGNVLYREMLNLEKAAKPYCVVGHSHGGSVIADALMLAAIERHLLQHLRRWITVGTPFIVPQKDRFLFSRLNRLGRAVLVAITTFAFCATLASYSSFEDDPGALVVGILAFAIVPYLLVYLTLWQIDRRRHWHFRRRSLATFEKTFAARWFGVWHKDDEAICGLAALGSADRKIFDRMFAVPMLSMLAVVLFPVLVYVVLSSQDLAQWLLDYHVRTFGPEKLKGIVEAAALKGGGKEVGINFVLLLTTGGEVFALILPASASTARAMFLIGIVPITALMLSLFILMLVTYAAKPVSIVLSHLLNAATWQQLRQTGFGGDVQGESAIESRAVPIGFSRLHGPLPDDIASEVSAVSNTAAAKSIPRLREAMNAIAFAKGEGRRGGFTEYLTWNELIHSTYFDVPTVRKLIAYAIAVTDGFRATDLFRSDPDYARVGQSYRMLDVASADRQAAISQSVGEQGPRCASTRENLFARLAEDPPVHASRLRRGAGPRRFSMQATMRGDTFGEDGEFAAQRRARVMKRVICCLDGTWNHNRPGAILTNVYKLHQAIAPSDGNEVRQISHYIEGIVSGETEFMQFLKGGVGIGLDDRIRTAYEALARDYEAGDEIYLIGFSRGAFAARSLGGLISLIGLAKSGGAFSYDKAWALYRTREERRDQAALMEMRAAAHYPVRIKCIAVWDTVGNLGNPFFSGGVVGRRFRFHDTRLSDNIDVALHALSIDEVRGPFRPTLWSLPEGQTPSHQHVEQMWFAGTHADIGGGHPETGLSDVALMWMVERIQTCTGLALDMQKIQHVTRPDPLGPQHAVTEGWIFGWSRVLPFIRLVKQATDAIPGVRRMLLGSWRTGKLPGDQTVINESVHDSVLERFGAQVIELRSGRSRIVTYAPRNLAAVLPGPALRRAARTG